MSDEENRGVIERYWRALEAPDLDAALAELHDDFVETFPQSGQTIRRKTARRNGWSRTEQQIRPSRNIMQHPL